MDCVNVHNIFIIYAGVHELPKHECINDNASDSTLSNSSASSSSSHKTLNQCVNVMPRVSYDPQVRKIIYLHALKKKEEIYIMYIKYNLNDLSFSGKISIED